MYDAFISHATENKSDVARPLAYSLVKRGYRLWYDEFELKPGDSLRREIDKALTKSRKGIIILSKDFFKKEWVAYELNGLLQLEFNAKEPRIIPVWHDVSHTDVLNFSPSLADKFACNTKNGIEAVANALSRSLGNPNIIEYSEQPIVRQGDDLCPKCGNVGGIFNFENGYRWLECPVCGHIEPSSDYKYLDPGAIRFHQLHGSDDI